MSGQVLPMGFVVLIPFSALLSVIGLWVFWQTGLAVSHVLNNNDSSHGSHSGTGNNVSTLSRRKSQISQRRSESGPPTTHNSCTPTTTQWVLFLTVLCSACFFLGTLLVLIYSIMVVIRLYDSNHDSDDKLTNQRVKNIEKHKDLHLIWLFRQILPNVGYISLLIMVFLRLVSVFGRTQYALSKRTVNIVKYHIVGGFVLIAMHRIVDSSFPNPYSSLLIVPVAIGYPLLCCWVAYSFYYRTKLIAANIAIDLSSNNDINPHSSRENSENKPNETIAKSVSYSAGFSASPKATSVDGLIDTEANDIAVITDHASSPIPGLTTGAESPLSGSVSPMAESITRTVSSWPSALNIHTDLSTKNNDNNNDSNNNKSKQRNDKSSRLVRASLKLTIITVSSTIVTVGFIIFWYAAIIIGESPLLRVLHLYLFPLDSFANQCAMLFYFASSDRFYFLIFGPLHRYLVNKMAQSGDGRNEY